jgi:thiamine-phosphate pyrophosphorylase
LDGPVSHSLYLLFTPALCAGEPWSTLERALAGGVDLVQWRAKRDDPDGLRRCMAICAARDVPVIVNDQVALAVRFGAAGAHVGQGDLPAATARRILGPDRWLGVSTHDHAEIEAARTAGADHIGFGPMFPTRTKGYAEGQPEGALEEALILAGPLPVFAIGGIDAAGIGRILRAGCRRVAVSGAILAAADPERAAATLRAALLA